MNNDENDPHGKNPKLNFSEFGDTSLTLGEADPTDLQSLKKVEAQAIAPRTNKFSRLIKSIKASFVRKNKAPAPVEEVTSTASTSTKAMLTTSIEITGEESQHNIRTPKQIISEFESEALEISQLERCPPNQQVCKPAPVDQPKKYASIEAIKALHGQKESLSLEVKSRFSALTGEPGLSINKLVEIIQSFMNGPEKEGYIILGLEEEKKGEDKGKINIKVPFEENGIEWSEGKIVVTRFKKAKAAHVQLFKHALKSKSNYVKSFDELQLTFSNRDIKFSDFSSFSTLIKKHVKLNTYYPKKKNIISDLLEFYEVKVKEADSDSKAVPGEIPPKPSVAITSSHELASTSQAASVTIANSSDAPVGVQDLSELFVFNNLITVP